MKNKILHFTKSDIETAGGYFDYAGCLACTAIRRTFNLPANAKVRATGFEVGFQIPGKSPKTFEFCGNGGTKISSCYCWIGRPLPSAKPFRIMLRPISPAKSGLNVFWKKG